MAAISVWTYVVIIVSVISLFLLSYLWFKFWNFRKHFLIAPRFPKITLLASISIFICGIGNAIIALILDHLNINREEATSSRISYPILLSIVNMSAYLFSSAIVFRTLLIFDAWCFSKYTLNNKNSIILANDFMQVSKYQIYKFCGSFYVFYSASWVFTVASMFLMLLIIVSICAPLTSFGLVIPSFLFMLSWFLIIIIGIVILIKTRKIKEAILCIRETYIVISILFIQIISIPFGGMIEIHIQFLLETLLALSVAYMVIVVPIYMIYKNEGSLEQSTVIKSHNAKINHEEEKCHQTPIPTPVMTSSKSTEIKPLCTYLEELENYNEFATFLSSCFALENLLFFSKVLVFRHVLLKIMKTEYEQKQQNKPKDNSIVVTDEKEEESVPNVSENDQVFYDKWCSSPSIFGVKFEFLEGIYESCSANDNVSIYDIGNKIVNQYISSAAINQVNISAVNRNIIMTFFSTNVDKCVKDYLQIFNGAILEIYGVLNSVYAFRFKSHSKIAE
eukprot:277638_1